MSKRYRWQSSRLVWIAVILLGFAAARGGLFCGVELLERIIMEKIPARFRDNNIAALCRGAAAAKE